MLDILRESSFGELLNWATNGRVFPYPDQRPGFIIPQKFLQNLGSVPQAPIPPADTLDDSGDMTRVGSKSTFTYLSSDKPVDKNDASKVEPLSLRHNKAIEDQLEGGIEESSQDEVTLKKTLHGDYILVDWYHDKDPENPRNWSPGKRYFVLVNICLLTFACYMGSAIYTASIPYLIRDYGISTVVATLGLSLYVFMYGIGPMFLSPLQELPSLGRNPVYMVTISLFAILQVAAALVNNVPGLLVLRAITGFLASPALATGGASVSDVSTPEQIPYTLGVWAMAACAGPVLGPIVGNFAAQANGWRWPIWELAWISGFAAIFLFIWFPETLPDTILLKRARRLRKLTGNDKLHSLSEIEQASLSKKEIAKEYLLRPFLLMTEPAILFINVYVGFAYSIFYLWFEAFPLVFIDIYHFRLGVSGLPYLGIVVGAFVGYIINSAWTYWYINPKWKSQGFLEPEERLKLAIVAGIMIPVSLLIFGWTSRENVHWIAPIIGAGIYMPGIYLMFQSAIVYLPSSYPKYTASLLAGNDLFRSTSASAFPLFGRPFYKALGIGGGSSLLAGIAILMIPCLWILMKRGAQLRAMSKYTESM